MKISPALGILLLSCHLDVTRAESVPCPPDMRCDEVSYTGAEQPSWIFRRSTYSHDPYSGARVAQYMRTPPVEPLDDERMVTSRLRRSRTNIRGMDGSVDTYYEVQSWGNGRGGLDAEWERFHDAWQESFLQGGWHHQGPGFGPAWGSGFPWGFPGGGIAPGGFPPGFGYGHPGYGYPGWHTGRPVPGVPHHPGHGGHRGGRDRRGPAPAMP